MTDRQPVTGRQSAAEPDAALEDRVVRAQIASGDIRPRWTARRRLVVIAGGIAAAAAALLLLLPRAPRTDTLPTYALLLYNNSGYQHPAPGHMEERIAEYARWADSLDRKRELQAAGRLEGAGEGDVGGLFIVRARNQAEADSVAATCPHIRYGGRIEVRKFIQ
jgi:hypothetical protein